MLDKIGRIQDQDRTPFLIWFFVPLRTDSWRLPRISGSHHILGKPGSVVRLSIPVHANRPLKLGLLRHPTNLAEVPEDEIN